MYLFIQLGCKPWGGKIDQHQHSLIAAEAGTIASSVIRLDACVGSDVPPMMLPLRFISIAAVTNMPSAQ